jgi:hypothetical protein
MTSSSETSETQKEIFNYRLLLQLSDSVTARNEFSMMSPLLIIFGGL